MNEQNESTSSSLVDNLKEFVSLKIKITSLAVAETTATLIANLVSSWVPVIFALLFVLFGSVSLSLYFGELWSSMPKGFMAVAGIWLILSFLCYFMRESIERLIVDSIIKNIFKKKSDESN